DARRLGYWLGHWRTRGARRWCDTGRYLGSSDDPRQSGAAGYARDAGHTTGCGREFESWSLLNNVRDALRYEAGLRWQMKWQGHLCARTRSAALDGSRVGWRWWFKGWRRRDNGDEHLGSRQDIRPDQRHENEKGHHHGLAGDTENGGHDTLAGRTAGQCCLLEHLRQSPSSGSDTLLAGRPEVGFLCFAELLKAARVQINRHRNPQEVPIMEECNFRRG